ncbi:hypothetical protein VNO78_28660 [Psophocarpus tetragonolobus]|uniref:Uncharacterized protein n=1 Tax=Psophocarpus tetragonolobus TaxID=3891 RepID=A0AAN9WYN4_PSOTE
MIGCIMCRQFCKDKERILCIMMNKESCQYRSESQIENPRTRTKSVQKVSKLLLFAFCMAQRSNDHSTVPIYFSVSESWKVDSSCFCLLFYGQGSWGGDHVVFLSFSTLPIYLASKIGQNRTEQNTAS